MRDLDVSKVLFHEHVPVAIRGEEKEEYYSETNVEEDVEEERVEICSVRVMLGPTGNTQTSSKSRVLRVPLLLVSMSLACVTSPRRGGRPSAVRGHETEPEPAPEHEPEP